MSGVNLHDYVRGAIEYLHPDETVILFRSDGYSNDNGRVSPSYVAGVIAKAQIQNPGATDSLVQSNHMSQSTVAKKFWLYGDYPTQTAGLSRPFCRGGDMIYRTSESTWWLVTQDSDDFSRVGWVSVLCTQQHRAPNGVDISEYLTGTGADPETETDNTEADNDEVTDI